MTHGKRDSRFEKGLKLEGIVFSRGVDKSEIFQAISDQQFNQAVLCMYQRRRRDD
jgi:hypothetical protein